MEPNLPYQYIGEKPYRCVIEDEKYFDIPPKAVIIKSKGLYFYGIHMIEVPESLRKYLRRLLTDEEKEYYNKLRDNAAVAVLPNIAKMNLYATAADKAVEYANALVRRLMDEE